MRFGGSGRHIFGQFQRDSLDHFIPAVSARGGKVLVQGPTELRSLLCELPGMDGWINATDPLPAFDTHCPLLSLPRVLQVTSQTIPPPASSLKVPSDKIRHWEKRLAVETSLPKIGLVWAGNPIHVNDRKRSLGLRQLAPLFAAKQFSFISLQKGAASSQAREFPEIRDWTRELEDFTDTAALIANLDLVIAVDTAVAHLTATMGKDAWVLLPRGPDWRWGLDAGKTPWYPTMRLFRQKSAGDWNEVIQRVALKLAEYVPPASTESHT